MCLYKIQTAAYCGISILCHKHIVASATSNVSHLRESIETNGKRGHLNAYKYMFAFASLSANQI